MKVLVIPDIHLKPWMFKAAEHAAQRVGAEKYIILGDLVDSHDIVGTMDVYRETLDEAIRFAKDHPDSLWCWGNHDISYMCDIEQSEYYEDAAPLIKERFSELINVLPKSHIQFIHRIDNCLFLHGGLSVLYTDTISSPTGERKIDELLSAINSANMDSVASDYMSPVWYRPSDDPEWIYEPEDMIQIVGHTPVRRITQKGSTITCDTFACYTNGIPYGDKTFLLLDTITHKWEAIEGSITYNK